MSSIDALRKRLVFSFGQDGVSDDVDNDEGENGHHNGSSSQTHCQPVHQGQMGRRRGNESDS